MLAKSLSQSIPFSSSVSSYLLVIEGTAKCTREQRFHTLKTNYCSLHVCEKFLKVETKTNLVQTLCYHDNMAEAKT